MLKFAAFLSLNSLSLLYFSILNSSAWVNFFLGAEIIDDGFWSCERFKFSLCCCIMLAALALRCWILLDAWLLSKKLRKRCRLVTLIWLFRSWSALIRYDVFCLAICFISRLRCDDNCCCCCSCCWWDRIGLTVWLFRVISYSLLALFGKLYNGGCSDFWEEDSIRLWILA